MFKQLTLATIAAVMFLGGCSDSEQKHSEEAESADALIAKTAYSLSALDGREFEITKAGTDFILKNAKTPLVIYDIFATWCPPCRAEAPHLSSLQKKYKDKITIIGVSIEAGKDNAFFQKFADDIGVTYTLVNSPDNQRLSRAIAGAIGIGQDFPIPLLVVYKEGRFVKYYTGLIPEEMLESDIQQLLGE
jgi:thiol-disulfide isomerase/thioredoxin